jgi:hypothetical protein
MAMTKKDYEAIAAAIRESRGAFADREVAEKIADHAAKRDRTFNRARFMKACGVAYPDHEGDQQ